MADPTVGDVFDQLVFVNSKLDQIQTNTLPIVASINHLDGHLVNGFNATAVALTTIAQINTEATKLLFHLAQQTDAMICILEHISKNTCGILTQVTLQTGINTSISDDTAVLREIAESSHPDAVLNRQRLEKLRTQVEQCCPPQQPVPACTYGPCPAPSPIHEPALPKVPDVPKQDTQPGSANKPRRR